MKVTESDLDGYIARTYVVSVDHCSWTWNDGNADLIVTLGE